MKISTLVLATAASFGLATAASAAVLTSATAPTGAIASNPTGTTFSRIIDIDVNANHVRGNGFTLGDNTSGDSYQIDSITIQKNGNQTYVAGDTITLSIYKGTSAQFNTGTGHVAADGTNYYNGTSVTPLATETFALLGVFTSLDFVTFQLTAPITVDDNADYGFLFEYKEAATSSEDWFQYNEAGTAGRTSITTTAHGTTTSRSFHYYVNGSAVPEPGSLALLGLGGLLVARRRRA